MKGGLPFVKYFRDLEVYKVQQALEKEVLALTFGFPKDEKYSLTDQIRRSSRSIGAQIAEAWGKRRYKKHFISKLTDAIGELLETQHWIGSATNCGYIDSQSASVLTEKYEDLNKMLNSMINKSDSFCE